MKFDYLTLFAVMGFVDVIIVIILLYYITVVSSKKWFIIVYLAYKLFETLAMIALSLRGIASEFLAVKMAIPLLYISIFLHLVSVVSYTGNLNKKFAYGIGTMLLISAGLFFLYYSSTNIRTAIFSFSIAISYLTGGVYLFLTRKEYKLPILLAAGCIVYATLNVARGIVMLYGSTDYNFYELATWDNILIMAGIATILISSFGFLLLLKEVDDKFIFKQNRITAIAFDESPVSIVITDTKGNIEFVNPKFAELTGYSLEESIGNNTNVLKTNLTPEETYHSLWKTIRTGDTWSGEFINKKKNGETYYEEAVIAPIKNEKNDITNYLAIKTDITQRKAHEELIQLRNKELSEINDTKDRLFSIIGHDLKGPIGNLRQLLDFINQDIEKGDQQSVKKILELSQETAKTSFNLLENLLNWSRSQLNALSPEPSVFDLSELTKEVAQIYQAAIQQKKITLKYDFSSAYLVNADKEMVSAIIRNLLSNAIKFTPIYGNISIDIENKEDKINLSVNDTGVGIGDDRIDKIFDFVKNQSTSGTSGEKGTGLGLVISKDFALKNNGDIWVESHPEKGSSFYVSLPKTA
jgi:PAS domain S-box-containing protein